MNKEEIEDIKADLRILHEILQNEHREGTDTIQRTLEYINYLEQKETILDKVVEECIKQMTANEDTILEIFPQKLLNIIEGEN